MSLLETREFLFSRSVDKKKIKLYNIDKFQVQNDPIREMDITLKRFVVLKELSKPLILPRVYRELPEDDEIMKYLKSIYKYQIRFG